LKTLPKLASVWPNRSRAASGKIKMRIPMH
jgi:hypothetical protein